MQDICYNARVIEERLKIAGAAARRQREAAKRAKKSVPTAVEAEERAIPVVEEGDPQEIADRYYQERYVSASEEEKEAIKRAVLGAYAAQEDNVKSFKAFYEVVHGKKLPKHATVWLKEMYRVMNGEVEGKEGVVIEAFRGSGKTTTLTITWAAYRIGKDPTKSNLLVQVGDDIAADNTRKIADLIENNPGWKIVFPHIVPDQPAGWGAGGYEVKRSDISYPEWRQMNAQRNAPTLVGVGYKSREIIGKHPNGLLLIDDIHDENNTSSQRELDSTLKIVLSTILPTRVKGTLVVVVGTPWVEGDVLHYLKGTGQFTAIKTPAFRQTYEGERVYAWPEMLGKKELDAAEKLSGQVEFARMYKLDLTGAQNRVFKYQTYPADKVDWNWLMAGGVDYAGNMTTKANQSGGGDYFAMAYVAKLPGHGMVVVDGVLCRPTQAEAEAHVKRPQDIFTNWRGAAVESDGRGLDFIQVLRRNPGLKIVPMGTRKRTKHERLVKELSPWLENGTIWISNADTPFLNELRKELADYPLCAHDDALDAVYYAVLMFPEALTIPDTRDGIAGVIGHQRKTNPFVSLGRW